MYDQYDTHSERHVWDTLLVSSTRDAADAIPNVFLRLEVNWVGRIYSRARNSFFRILILYMLIPQPFAYKSIFVLGKKLLRALYHINNPILPVKKPVDLKSATHGIIYRPGPPGII